MNRLHRLVNRGSFFQPKITWPPKWVIINGLISHWHIWRLAYSEGRELGGVEGEESASSKGESVGCVDDHHLIVLRVIIGLHLKEYNWIIAGWASQVFKQCEKFPLNRDVGSIFKLVVKWKLCVIWNGLLDEDNNLRIFNNAPFNNPSTIYQQCSNTSFAIPQLCTIRITSLDSSNPYFWTTFGLFKQSLREWGNEDS